MSSHIREISAPIAQDLNIFENKFREFMKSKVPLLDHITHYIVKRKGKRIRPMFVFLSAGLCGKVSESTHRGAALIELLHTATLVHDDVVDDSYQRRGVFSINALWKNKIAVLVGDYLLSKGLLLSVEKQEYEMLRIVSDAVKSMSEGELLQIEKARRLDIKESVYFEIIRSKTASLIASACSVGAVSSGTTNGVVQRMHDFGEKIGMAFQIKDDLLDFGNGDTGKPHAIDIQERKLTLPLIYTLSNCDRAEKRWIINTVKRHNRDKDRVGSLVTMVRDRGGIEYADARMKAYRSEALELLGCFPDSPCKESLRKLIEFTTDRTF